MTSIAFVSSINVVTPSKKTIRLIRQNLLLVKPCRSWITPLFSTCFSIASRKTCPMTFPGTEVGLTGHSHLTALTFQIAWRVTWQLHESIPSGFWDSSHQVQQICVYSGSSGAHKPDHLSHYEGVCSSSLCLVVHPLKRFGKTDYQWRLGQNTCWVPLSSHPLFAVCQPCLSWKAGSPCPFFSGWHTCRSS